MIACLSVLVLPIFKSTNKILSILFISLFVITGCEDSPSQAESSENLVTQNVVISNVEQQVLPSILSVPGTVVTKNKLKVASRITGFIEQVNVEEGDIVKPGDVLVKIDNSQVEAAIKSAESAVSAAKANLVDAAGDVKRIKELVHKEITAEDDLRNAIVRQAQAKSTLASAEATLVAKRQERRYSHITSPVHAQVRQRLRGSGDLATSGEPILQLDVLGVMELHIYIPSTQIDYVEIGQKVNIKLEFREELLESTIVNIVRSADTVTRRYKVRLQLPADEHLAPGQFAQAQIVLRDEMVTTIPTPSVTQRAGIEGVFIVDANHILHFRSVRLGRTWQELREVLAGIEPGTSLVLNPSSQLHEGDTVRLGESQ